jgi:predicted metal-dependent HD superfamily phosphohydrolase
LIYLSRSVTITAKEISMFTDLARRYSEPHRVYHVLTHPASMIEFGLKKFELTDEQILAIWYHDVIYTPGSPTNEAESADYFAEKFKDNKEINCEDVRQIILDTKSHIPSIKSSELVIDLDLMGLGSDFSVYVRAAVTIRKEFAAFSDPEWRIGRMKFLENMGTKKQIFYTEYFIENFEMKARFNMLAELQYLKNHQMRYY